MSNKIKNILLIVFIFLTGCVTHPKNPEYWIEKEINACMPTAIIFKQSLRKYDIWSEVFRYSYKDKTGKFRGHAMVAYLYPPGKNQLWTYDSMGSTRIRAYTNNILDIAQKSHYARNWYDKVLYTEYVK